MVITGYRKDVPKPQFPWIAFLERKSGKLVRQRRCIPGHMVFGTTSLPSERVVVTRGMAYAFEIVHRKSSKPGRRLSLPGEEMSQSQRHGTATLDGLAFAHSDLGGGVTVWSTRIWKRIRTLSHDLEVEGLAFSPGGHFLAVLLEGGSITYHRTHL